MFDFDVRAGFYGSYSEYCNILNIVYRGTLNGHKVLDTCTKTEISNGYMDPDIKFVQKWAFCE